MNQQFSATRAMRFKYDVSRPVPSEDVEICRGRWKRVDKENELDIDDTIDGVDSFHMLLFLRGYKFLVTQEEIEIEFFELFNFNKSN